MDVLPDADLARDLGGENRYWRRLFVGTVVFSDGTELSSASGLGGADIVSLNKASADTQVTTTAETLIAEIAPDAGKTRIAYIDSVRLVAINPALSAYRVPITIAEQSGNSLTDYAVKITLDSSWGGWSYVSSDGSDIFFTDDQENPLYFWIEQWDYANKHAVIWVKVPSIPANGTVTVYMWFGGTNPYNSYHDPEQVFMFFDDFDKGILDTEKWVEFDSGGTYEFTDSCIYLKPILYQNNGVALRSKIRVTNNIEVRARVIAETDTYYDLGIVKNPDILTNSWHGSEAGNIGYWLEAQHISSSENKYILRRRDPGSSTNLAETPEKPIKYELEYILRYRDDGTLEGLGILPDGSVWFSLSAKDTTYLSDEKYVVIWQGAYSDGRGGYSKWDWVLVRKYTDPEPSVSIGSVESVGVSLFLDARAVLDDGSEAGLIDGYVEVRPGESLDRLFSDVWRSVPNGRYVVAVRLYGYVSQEPVAGNEPTARIEVYGLQA